jgi:hypothetical protein
MTKTLRRCLFSAILAVPLIQLMGMGSVGLPQTDYISIVAVGDIMMGSTYPANMLPDNDGKGIFDGVSEPLRGGDILFGNLEGPLLDGGKAAKCKKKNSGACFEFRTPARYVRHLKDAGFGVVNIANNHILDFGPDGANQTIQALIGASIKPVGGNTIASFEIRNKKIAVVGFSYLPGPYAHSMLDIEEAAGIIQELKKTNDIVAVSFHGGAEGSQAIHVSDRDELFLGENRGNVVRFAHSAIEAGADLVIGHGPHVLRALEIYKGKLIAYSLGNFLTYGRFNIKGPNGLSVVPKVRIDSRTGRFAGGELVPVILTKGGIPELDGERGAIKLIKRLILEDIAIPGISISDGGTVHPVDMKEPEMIPSNGMTDPVACSDASSSSVRSRSTSPACGEAEMEECN